MYAKPYDRKFGIEFEFNIPGIQPEYSTADNGRYPSKYWAVENLLTRNGLKGFRVHGDGSEFEAKTPILSGPNGFKVVKKFIEVIEDAGGRTNHYDGLHVHHDAPEFVDNKPLVQRLVENWFENQPEILKMVNPYRHTSGACTQWRRDAIEELKSASTVRNEAGYYWGRKNLNISSLGRHGTIEIRLHEGTLDYEQVFSWVRFGQAFIAKALDESGDILERAVSTNDLLKKINISRNASRFITKKMQSV